MIFVDGTNPNAGGGNGTIFSPCQRLSKAVNNTIARGCPAKPAIISVAKGHYEGFSFALTKACPFKLVASSGPILIGPRPIPLRNP